MHIHEQQTRQIRRISATGSGVQRRSCGPETFGRHAPDSLRWRGSRGIGFLLGSSRPERIVSHRACAVLLVDAFGGGRPKQALAHHHGRCLWPAFRRCGVRLLLDTHVCVGSHRRRCHRHLAGARYPPSLLAQLEVSGFRNAGPLGTTATQSSGLPLLEIARLVAVI